MQIRQGSRFARRPIAPLVRGLAVAPLLLALACFASPAAAVPTCTITASDVAFGSVDPLAGGAVDVSASILVECTEITAPVVDSTVGVCLYLDEGDGGSDGSAWRHMHQGGEILRFNLYKDAARTQVWGSDTAFSASGAQLVTVTLSGVPPATGSLTVPVYGRIPGDVSDRRVGAYQSTFTGGARARYSLVDALPCDGFAGTQVSDTFVATATIAETCTVEADDLAFPTRAQLDAGVEASSQVRASCSTGLPFAIALGPGGGGAFGARRMQHAAFPAETVGYQLFTDAARTLVWGDGSGGTLTVGGTGDGQPQASTVYGRVPAQATPRPGDYADTVIVTVSY